MTSSTQAGRARLRRPREADAAAIVALVAKCFEEYRTFAPAGWEPPGQAGAVGRMEAALARPATGGLVAMAEDGHAGHVLWIPATDSERLDSEDEATAYLWQLFVARERRASGLAAELLGRATSEAAAAGYDEMRLLTLRDHSRARRFYEREGWTLLGDWGIDPDLRLSLVEYGRRLRAASGQNGSP